ncbi:MAG: hypothetical protein AB7U83_16660 [Vicinamibacterales bacterium]
MELAIRENSKLNGTLLAVDTPGRITGRRAVRRAAHSFVVHVPVRD